MMDVFMHVIYVLSFAMLAFWIVRAKNNILLSIESMYNSDLC